MPRAFFTQTDRQTGNQGCSATADLVESRISERIDPEIRGFSAAAAAAGHNTTSLLANCQSDRRACASVGAHV